MRSLLALTTSEFLVFLVPVFSGILWNRIHEKTSRGCCVSSYEVTDRALDICREKKKHSSVEKAQVSRHTALNTIRTLVFEKTLPCKAG